MQVGMTINQAEIGGPLSISGPAMDQSNVETSEKFVECGQQALGDCTHKFKLSGEYVLEPVCEGTISEGSLNCGGGSNSKPSGEENKNKSPENKNPPNNPGGGKEKEEAEKKKKEEEAKAAAKKQKEAKKEEAGAHASVKIESVKLTGGDLLVKVKTSESGTVTVTGAGLKKTTKTLAAGTHTLKVPVSKKAQAKHQKTRLTVSLKVGDKTASATKKLTL